MTIQLNTGRRVSLEMLMFSVDFPSDLMQSLIIREEVRDINTVCLIRSIGAQLSPTQPGVMKNKTSRDPILY